MLKFSEGENKALLPESPDLFIVHPKMLVKFKHRLRLIPPL